MITPVDIRNQPFKRALRGFDPDEVKNFLNSLSQEWENIIIENKTLKIELEKTKESLQSYREMESMLHKTLMQAEQSSRVVVENAQREAELKIIEAEQQANNIVQGAVLDADMKRQEAEQKTIYMVNKAYDERSRIEMEINELVHRRHEILNQLAMYLSAQLDRIHTFEQKEMGVIKINSSEQLRQENLHQMINGNSIPTSETPAQSHIYTNSLGQHASFNEKAENSNTINSANTGQTGNQYNAPSPGPSLEPIDIQTKIIPPQVPTPAAAASTLLNETSSFFDKAVKPSERTGLIHTIVEDLE